MNVWIWTLGSVILVSLISLIGIITLSLNKGILENLTRFLVSFAVGGLYGDAFIHLIPETFDKLGVKSYSSLYIISGILIFFVLEKFLRWRHCHISSSENHYHPIAMINLIGDAFHNFIDGILIGASFIVSIPLGITTAIAIVFHEIPQEIGDFGVLLHCGVPVKKALLFNFFAALTAVLGAVLSLIIGKYMENYALMLLPITAGGFIYIAGSDLIPELQRVCDVKASSAFWQFIFILLGIIIMFFLTFLD